MSRSYFTQAVDDALAQEMSRPMEREDRCREPGSRFPSDGRRCAARAMT